MERRSFLWSLGALTAWLGIGVGSKTPATTPLVDAEPNLPDREILDGLVCEFHPYISPGLTGWKGYWFTTTHNGEKFILAFEDMKKGIHATPMALLIPEYVMRPTSTDALLHETTFRPVIHYNKY